MAMAMILESEQEVENILQVNKSLHKVVKLSIVGFM